MVVLLRDFNYSRALGTLNLLFNVANIVQSNKQFERTINVET